MIVNEKLERTNDLWTIPNVLCFIRLVGSPALIWLAVADHRVAFVCWFVFLMMTDWLDGKLAILLNQRSVFGAKIDTWADAAMYGCTLLGVAWLCLDVLLGDRMYIAVVLATYFVNVIFSLLKFSAWPTYHTRSAKTAWLLMLIGVSALILSEKTWPYRIAVVGVFIAVVESIAITATLEKERVNVASIFHALKERKLA